jgi:hypothetical protein
VRAVEVGTGGSAGTHNRSSGATVQGVLRVMQRAVRPQIGHND